MWVGVANYYGRGADILIKGVTGSSNITQNGFVSLRLYGESDGRQHEKEPRVHVVHSKNDSKILSEARPYTVQPGEGWWP